MPDTNQVIVSITDTDGKVIRTKPLPSEKATALVTTLQQRGFQATTSPMAATPKRPGGLGTKVDPPTGKAAAFPAELTEIAKENLPYLALLGIQPESALLGAALRIPAGAGIDAIKSYLKGEDVTAGAIKGAGMQALAETISPILQIGPRLGGGKLKTIEDKTVDRLITGIKKLVPWLRPLGEGHVGMDELLRTGKGQRLLTENYGDALQAVEHLLPPDHATPLLQADAKALGAPIVGAVTPTGATPASQALVMVPTKDLIHRISGVGKKNPGLASRTLEALDANLPDVADQEFFKARRLFREGTSFWKALDAAGVIDEASGRFSLERFTTATRTGFGTPGEAGGAILREQNAPGAAALLEAERPKPGTPIPRYMGLFRPGERQNVYGNPAHIGVSTHGGERLPGTTGLTRMSPSLKTYSGGIPLSETEKAVKKWAPAVLRSAGGTAYDALTGTSEPPYIPEGVTP
jgi:hypothetical protein